MTCFERGDALDHLRDALQAIRQNPTGSMSFTGQRISPPAFDEASSMFQESTNQGQVK